MLGYMNEEAFNQTQKTKRVIFFSRSKKRLWQKGEASGNVLKLVSIQTDCDRDALLIKAIPKGPTCHTGTQSCFGEDSKAPLQVITGLIEVIKQRSEIGDPKSSYTKRLLDGGTDVVGEKVLEEAQELVKAAKKEGKKRTIEEAADLIYHMIVLLKATDISISDIEDELSRRASNSRQTKRERLHTADHILCTILEEKFDAKTRAMQVSEDCCRIDFLLKEDLRPLKEQIEKEVNEVIQQGRNVISYSLPRNRAQQITDISFVPPQVKDIGIYEIEGFNIVACAGPHVENTEEIGTFKILKIKKAGSNCYSIKYTVT